MLAYPFRLSVLGWWLGLSLAAVAVQAFTAALQLQWFPRFQLSPSPGGIVFAVIGVALEVFWWLLAFKIALEAMRAAAGGREDDPGREYWAEDAQALRQLLLWAALLLAAYLVYLPWGAGGLLIYCGLLALPLPAILVLLGIENSLLRALDPIAWLQLLQRAGLDYLMMAAKLLALGLLVFAAEGWLQSQPRWLGVPLSRFVLLYVLFAGYHELGRLAHRHRRESRRPQKAPVAKPQEASPEEDMALRAAERYSAEGRLPKAAQQLEPLLLDPATSVSVHARYRDLLSYAGDAAGLLAHARNYVPLLMARGRDDEALALYLDSVAAEPAFELAAAADVSKLMAIAMRDQRPELAVSLAEGFLRRFPTDPDALPNGLSAARLMDRLGRGEQARHLLVDLVRHFPTHPMRGELVAALETLEEAARRGR